MLQKIRYLVLQKTSSSIPCYAKNFENDFKNTSLLVLWKVPKEVNSRPLGPSLTEKLSEMTKKKHHVAHRKIILSTSAKQITFKNAFKNTSLSRVLPEKMRYSLGLWKVLQEAKAPPGHHHQRKRVRKRSRKQATLLFRKCLKKYVNGVAMTGSPGGQVTIWDTISISKTSEVFQKIHHVVLRKTFLSASYYGEKLWICFQKNVIVVAMKGTSRGQIRTLGTITKG